MNKFITRVVFSAFIVGALFMFIGFGGMSSAVSPNRFIVLTDEPVNGATRAALEAHGKVLKKFELVNGAVVLLLNEAAVERVGALSGVKLIEPDAMAYALKPPSACSPWPECKKDGDEEPPPDEEPLPSEPPQELPWGIDRVDAELAWNVSVGADVNVAVIDTGIDLDHPDLNVVRAVDCIRGPSCDRVGNGDDDSGHGTHVAGTIAALDNLYGVVGVAPKANLYGVKVLNSLGSGFYSDIIKGIEWAVANGADVINMSLGGTTDSEALHAVVDAAYNAGVVVVAAAGNDGDGDGATNNILYPARYDSVIAVGATDSGDGIPLWSSDGIEIELAAPGVLVKSTFLGGSYAIGSGTSMASPHVAGVVALVLGAPVQAAYDADSDGLWSPAEVRALLTATADDLGVLGHDNFFGWGLVDAEEAVTGVQTNL